MLEFLDELVEKAGRLTLGYYHMGVEVETKSDMTPVTIADRETEKFLRSEIMRRFPDDNVIGEEYGEVKFSTAKRTWILDPIDGTKSFVAGVPLYGTLIGVEENGEIIAGAVGLPALGENVVAERDKGCWLNGAQCHVNTKSKLSESILLTTDIVDIEKYGRKPAWDVLLERVKFARTWGDCYGHILVATGRAEIMFDPVMAIWDSAPFPIILQEAGGRCYDFKGGNSIRENGIISVNQKLSDEVMQIVREKLGENGAVFNE